jgi:tRNA(Arg) A34 adenosine deaminase TadA
MTDATLDPIPGLLARVRVVPRRDFLAAATALTAAAPLAAGVAQAQPAPGAAPTEQDRAYMRQAIELMRRAGVVEKTGGPFGAVVVREGRVLASSGNSVLRDNDPSAHAEVNAIRLACRAVNSPNLRGATLYSSCEPCPMCYATAYWARVERIFYAAAWTDYADLFDDSNISQDVAKPYPERRVPLQQILQGDAQAVWQEFRQTPGGARY